jgi:hypothetical protein
VAGSVSWDFDTVQTAAPGSDLWHITWADDGDLYTTWGDGGGFGGTDKEGRVSLGVARIEGSPNNWAGKNIFGGVDHEAPATFPGKAEIVAVDGALYLFVTEQGVWMRSKIGRSTDRGRTWTFNSGSFENSGWDFDLPDGAFGNPVPLQFGAGYSGARDEFVYFYSEQKRERFNTNLLLARVRRGEIADATAWEYYAGSGGDGQWTTEFARAVAVYSDANGVSWGVTAAYHPILERYLLATRRPDEANGRGGAWSLHEAPEPWGPWARIAYYQDWDAGTPFEGTDEQIVYTFPTKWMDDDVTLWMVVSMGDSFNIVGGTLSR